MKSPMTATTLTTFKKVAFTLLCCAVLMVVAASAQTIQSIKADPGQNNRPPAGPILDLGGAYATPTTSPLPIPGGGTGTYMSYPVYFTATSASTVITFAFRDDPAQISFTNASVTDVTTSEPGPNLLLNGSFATGDLTDWSYVDVYGVSGAGFVALSGSYSNNCPSINGVAFNCWIDGAVQAYDAIYQPITTVVGHTYLVSFDVAENSGIVAPPVPDGNSQFPVGYPGSPCWDALNDVESPYPCSFSDLSTDGDMADAGGNGINVTVYAAATAPPVTTVQAPLPINPDIPASLNQTVSNVTVPGQPVTFEANFLQAAEDGLTVAPGTNIYVGFNGMTRAQYQAIVAVSGTPFVGTSCLTTLGQQVNGANACEVNTITATTSASSFPSGANLPQDTSGPPARDIVLTQSYNLDPNQGGPISPPNPLSSPPTPAMLVIPPGTAPFLAELNDNETCQFPSIDPLYGQLCPLSIMTSIQDGATKPGGTPNPVGSSQVLACCEPEWTATPTIPLWSNLKTPIAVSFANSPPYYPATPPAGFQAAQGQGVLFGAVAKGVVLDPTLSFASEQLAANATSCLAPPNNTWANQNPQPFTASGSLTQYNNGAPSPGSAETLTDGAYSMLYAPLDCDDFLGLQYPASINIQGTQTAVNLANWWTAPFNVDTTPPTVAITLNPTAPGLVYAQNSSLTASLDCADPIVNLVASGIATCGPYSGLGGQNPVMPPAITLNTATTGSHTYSWTATDVAGNVSSTPSTVTYTVVGQDDLVILMFGNLTVKTGGTITYNIIVVNSGPNASSLTMVTDSLPKGTSFVSAGYAIDSATVSGGEITNWSITPPTISCGNSPASTWEGSCSIGTLPAWTSKNPVAAAVQITVKVTASAGATITNNAAVSSANTDSDVKHTTQPWLTLVTK